MTRCKAGDLAIIARDPFQENVGRVVLVIARARPIDGNAAWLVEAEGAPLRVLEIPSLRATYSGDGECCDVDLWPIGSTAVCQRMGAENSA